MLQVFPVMLLAAVIETTGINMKLRTKNWFRFLVIIGLSAGFWGTAWCYLAVMVSKSVEWVHLGASVFTWLCFPILAFTLCFQLIAIVASREVADDEMLATQAAAAAAAAQTKPTRFDYFLALIRGNLRK